MISFINKILSRHINKEAGFYYFIPYALNCIIIYSEYFRSADIYNIIILL